MAIHNPSNLYSGGQGVFDSRPSLMFQANLYNQKKAKEEAIGKYLQELPSKINSAGLQTKDLPEFDNIMREISDYWKNNKQDIINPKNSMAQTEYMGLIEKQKRHILKSKNGFEALKPFVTISQDPKKAARIPNVTLQKLALAELPVNDSDYREFQPSDMEFNNEPYDETKVFKKYFGDIKMSDSGTKIEIDPNTKTRKVTTTSGLTDNDKEAIYNRAVTLYDTNPSVSDYVEETLSNPVRFNELNNEFKKQYKRDINPSNPAELYAASIIGKFQTERNKIKIGTDPESMAYLNDALIRGRQQAAFARGEYSEEKLGQGIKSIMDDEEGNGNIRKYTLPGMGEIELIEVTPLPGIKNRLSIKDQWGDVRQAEKVFIDPATKNRLVFDKKGLIGQYTPTQYGITIASAELPSIPRVKTAKSTQEEIKGKTPKATETKKGKSTKIKINW